MSKYSNVQGETTKATLYNVLTAILHAQRELADEIKGVPLSDSERYNIDGKIEALFDIAMFAIGVPPDNEEEMDYLYGGLTPENNLFCWDFLYTDDYNGGDGIKNNRDFLGWVEEEMDKLSEHPHVKKWRNRKKSKSTGV